MTTTAVAKIRASLDKFTLMDDKLRHAERALEDRQAWFASNPNAKQLPGLREDLLHMSDSVHILRGEVETMRTSLGDFFTECHSADPSIGALRSEFGSVSSRSLSSLISDQAKTSSDSPSTKKKRSGAKTTIGTRARGKHG